MIVGLDHIGIAVNNLDEAINLYCDVLGLKFEGVHNLNERKLKVAFFSIGRETQIELLESTDSEHPISKFVEERGEGVHHIAFRVENVEAALGELKKKGLKLIDEKPRIGLSAPKIAFIDKKSTRGAIIELCGK